MSDANNLGDVLLALYEDPSESHGLTLPECDVLDMRLALMVCAVERERREAIERERAPQPQPVRERADSTLLTAEEAAALLKVPVRRMYRDARFRSARRRLGTRTLRFDKATLLREARAEA